MLQTAPSSPPTSRPPAGWPSWGRFWEPGRSFLLEPRALWSEEWSLAELLIQDASFGFQGVIHGAPDLSHPLRELLRRKGLWGGPGRRVVQRMVALAANFARLSGGGPLQARVLRVEGPRHDLMRVPEDRMRLLRFYLPGGLPSLPGHEVRPGSVLLLKPGASLAMPSGKARNLVLCLDARMPGPPH